MVLECSVVTALFNATAALTILAYCGKAVLLAKSLITVCSNAAKLSVVPGLCVALWHDDEMTAIPNAHINMVFFMLWCFWYLNDEGVVANGCFVLPQGVFRGAFKHVAVFVKLAAMQATAIACAASRKLVILVGALQQ